MLFTAAGENTRKGIRTGRSPVGFYPPSPADTSAGEAERSEAERELPQGGQGFAVNMKMTVAGDVLLLRSMIHGKGFEPLTRCV